MLPILFLLGHLLSGSVPAAAATPATVSSQDPARAFARAEEARARGDLATARKIYEEALAVHPRDGRLAIALGQTLVELGDLSAAEDLLTRLVRSLPERPEPHRALAGLYLRAGKSKEALSEATRAVELDPKSPDNRLALGAALSASGRPEQAITTFRRVLRSRPTDLRALHGLAGAYAALQDPQAEKIYQRLLTISPKDSNLRVEFAEYLWQMRQTDRGNQVMEKAIGETSDKGRLLARYGISLGEQGRFAEATKQLGAAVTAGGADEEVLFYLGSALWEVGRFEEAEQRLRQAVERAPEKTPARHRLGRLLIFRGQAAAAVPELLRAAELEPTSAAILLDLGRAQEAAGNLSDAEASFRKALDLEPNLSLTHYTLGTLLARAGRREEARAHIALYQEYFEKEQKRRFQAGSRQAELNLGWTLLRRKRPDQALAQFRRHPEDVEALRGAAAALSRLNRHAEAARELERALLLSPDDRRLRYELDREYGKKKSS